MSLGLESEDNQATIWCQTGDQVLQLLQLNTKAEKVERWSLLHYINFDASVFTLPVII